MKNDIENWKFQVKYDSKSLILLKEFKNETTELSFPKADVPWLIEVIKGAYTEMEKVSHIPDFPQS